MSQRIESEEETSLYEFTSCTLIDVMNERLFDQIQLGDKVFALYRENDDVELICSEFYACEVLGMAQVIYPFPSNLTILSKNGLFLRYEDGEKQIVKIGEIIKAI